MSGATVEGLQGRGMKGLITNLQDFAVHDGPGLRVIVFLKGCQMACKWCQNPENLYYHEEIIYHPSLCVDCGKCFEVCEIPGAVIQDSERRIDRTRCNRCMSCVETCMGNALVKVGEWVEAQEIVQRVLRYSPFFQASDSGGVTISGGDPLFQPEFTMELLRSFRASGIHSAIETCGYGDYSYLREMAQTAQLIIYDIKHMDEAQHKAGTGRPNGPVLENLQNLCWEVDTEIVVHLPLIPGFNDDEENIRETARYIRSLKQINHVDLLPFNYLAAGKYNGLGLDWEYGKAERQSDEHLAGLRTIIEEYGLEANVEGLW